MSVAKRTRKALWAGMARRVSAGAVAVLVACSAPPAHDQSAPELPATGQRDTAPSQPPAPADDDERGDHRSDTDDSGHADEADDGQRASAALERPAWLGTRILPLRADGFGQIQATPPELRDRQLRPPASQARAAGTSFEASIDAVPADVLARSTWAPHCPVEAGDLALVHVTFWGFDAHTYRGELLVHADVAEAMVEVFRRLFDAHFPIEEMRVIGADELDAPPTGDGNVTTAFVCRAPVTGRGWSQHAYGLAVDINPFHNPYTRGDLVIPELASAYTDRSDVRDGMIVAGDDVTAAFADIGWGWGGDWRSAHDPMHFSSTGR